MEAEKGNFYISAVRSSSSAAKQGGISLRSSTSAAKRGPTVRDFTAELYLCGETTILSRTRLQRGISLRSSTSVTKREPGYIVRFHCGALPPRRNEDQATCRDFTAELYLRGETRTIGLGYSMGFHYGVLLPWRNRDLWCRNFTTELYASTAKSIPFPCVAPPTDTLSFSTWCRISLHGSISAAKRGVIVLRPSTDGLVHRLVALVCVCVCVCV